MSEHRVTRWTGPQHSLDRQMGSQHRPQRLRQWRSLRTCPRNAARKAASRPRTTEELNDHDRTSPPGCERHRDPAEHTLPGPPAL